MTKKGKMRLVYGAGALVLLWYLGKDQIKSANMGGIYMNKIPGKKRMLMMWG